MQAAWKSIVLGAGALVVSCGLTGCISQGEYDRLYEANQSAENRAAELKRERDEARIALDQLRSSMGKGEGTLADLQRRNAELQAQLDRALSDYNSMQGKLGQLSFGPLDAETSNRLDQLAAQYPNLLSFDSARGMLRVSSDLTFDSGSAVVRDTAKQGLQALSDVLKSGAATQYEIIVEGHTDSQRIANPTTAREHKTNRHLSAHRAIAVIDVLGSMGVPNDRMMAAGWGEFRPAVQNTANGNTPQNRRVEIYLAKLADPGMPGETAEVVPDGSK
ncbi:MAG TPA: OmpA family protein [Phycisphaerales bacterium]|nr:OmpA family protein [Phycisphaerales bacterium]